jgi:hypothetical protein
MQLFAASYIFLFTSQEKIFSSVPCSQAFSIANSVLNMADKISRPQKKTGKIVVRL